MIRCCGMNSSSVKSRFHDPRLASRRPLNRSSYPIRYCWLSKLESQMMRFMTSVRIISVDSRTVYIYIYIPSTPYLLPAGACSLSTTDLLRLMSMFCLLHPLAGELVLRGHLHATWERRGCSLLSAGSRWQDRRRSSVVPL